MITVTKKSLVSYTKVLRYNSQAILVTKGGVRCWVEWDRPTHFLVPQTRPVLSIIAPLKH